MADIIMYGAYIFGLIVVLIFSVKEFNVPEYRYGNNDGDLDQESPYARLAKPTLPKYMADSSRYTVFMLAFALFAAGLYFLFANLLLLLPGIEVVLGIHENRAALSAILSAMLIIGVVKSDDIKLEKVQFFLKWPKIILFGLIKDWLHSVAYIPSLGCNVFNTLCYEGIDHDSQEVKKNLGEIFDKKYRDDFDVSEYLEINDFKSIGNPTNMISRWSRLSYFIFIIEKWSIDPKFKNQIKERSLGWLSLKDAYVSLIEAMIQYRDKNVDMSQNEENELSKQIDDLLANSYRLISCVVVMTARPAEDPLRYIKDIGLKVHPSEQMFARRGEVLRVVALVVPTIVLLAIFFASFDHVNDVSQTIKSIFVYMKGAFAIMLLPLILVLGLKRHMAIHQTWPMVTADNPYKSFFDMPLILYMVISALAWGFSLMLMMLLVNKNGMAIDMAQLKSMSIFCFISAITAFIACYRTDTPPKLYKSWITFMLRIVGLPAIYGILTALTVWVGLHMSAKTFSDDKFWQFPLLGFCIAMVIGVALFYGKHRIERRNPNDRIPCDEPVTVVHGDHKFMATMLNKSSNGVMLMLSHVGSMIQKKESIEIILGGGLRKVGSVVNMDMGKINVSWIKDPSAPPFEAASAS